MTVDMQDSAPSLTPLPPSPSSSPLSSSLPPSSASVEDAASFASLRFLLLGDTGVGKGTFITSFLSTLSNLQSRNISDEIITQPITSSPRSPEAIHLPTVHVRTGLTLADRNDGQGSLEDPLGLMPLNVQIPEREITFVDFPGYSSTLNPSTVFNMTDAYLNHHLHSITSVFASTIRPAQLAWFLIAGSAAHQLPTCAFYFVLYELKPIDILYMQLIQDRVNLVPIITKADTVSEAELWVLKKRLVRQLKLNKIRFHTFGQTLEQVEKQIEEKTWGSVPFVVSAQRLESGELYESELSTLVQSSLYKDIRITQQEATRKVVSWKKDFGPIAVGTAPSAETAWREKSAASGINNIEHQFNSNTTANDRIQLLDTSAAASAFGLPSPTIESSSASPIGLLRVADSFASQSMGYTSGSENNSSYQPSPVVVNNTPYTTMATTAPAPIATTLPPNAGLSIQPTFNNPGFNSNHQSAVTSPTSILSPAGSIGGGPFGSNNPYATNAFATGGIPYAPPPSISSAAATTGVSNGTGFTPIMDGSVAGVIGLPPSLYGGTTTTTAASSSTGFTPLTINASNNPFIPKSTYTPTAYTPTPKPNKDAAGVTIAAASVGAMSLMDNNTTTTTTANTTATTNTANTTASSSTATTPGVATPTTNGSSHAANARLTMIQNLSGMAVDSSTRPNEIMDDYVTTVHTQLDKGQETFMESYLGPISDTQLDPNMVADQHAKIIAAAAAAASTGGDGLDDVGGTTGGPDQVHKVEIPNSIATFQGDEMTATGTTAAVGGIASITSSTTTAAATAAAVAAAMSSTIDPSSLYLPHQGVVPFVIPPPTAFSGNTFIVPGDIYHSVVDSNGEYQEGGVGGGVGYPDIWEAVEMGDVATVQQYLNSGVSPDLRNKSGSTLLHRTAWQGVQPFAVMNLLIMNGANVNLANDNGNTVLQNVLMKHDDPALIQLLLNNGAVAMLHNKELMNALEVAALFNKLESAKYLLENDYSSSEPQSIGNALARSKSPDKREMKSLLKSWQGKEGEKKRRELYARLQQTATATSPSALAAAYSSLQQQQAMQQAQQQQQQQSVGASPSSIGGGNGTTSSSSSATNVLQGSNGSSTAVNNSSKAGSARKAGDNASIRSFETTNQKEGKRSWRDILRKN